MKKMSALALMLTLGASTVGAFAQTADKAIEYYEIAVAHGDSDAKPAVDNYASGLYRDGYALLQAGKYESALPLLVKAADLGNADALKIMSKK
jgi:TPR repeat protein